MTEPMNPAKGEADCSNCGDPIEPGLEYQHMCAYCLYLENGYFPPGFGMTQEEIIERGGTIDDHPQD